MKMTKKIVMILLAILPMGMMAQQGLKLGHVNSQEILLSMPEKDSIEAKISKLSKEWENELLKSQEEYKKKIKDFQNNNATMPETIKKARQAEISDLELRINNINQQAQVDIAQQQQALYTPVINKVRAAIEAVGTEGNYTYIFDLAAQNIVYQSPQSNDITPLVKKKLGLK